MAKKITLSDSEQVLAHIQKLDASIAPVISYLREHILSIDKNIAERIKWNNPSFYYAGEMAPFDPKEFKREIMVFNLFKNRIMLVFPSGAKIKKNKSLLEGNYDDGRRLIVLKDLDDAMAKMTSIQAIIKEWIELIDVS